MRILLSVLLLLTGCGPMDLSGNWRFSQELNGGGSYSGTLILRQEDGDLTGTHADNNNSGSVEGTIRGDEVSMTWRSTGFQPWLVTADAKSDSSMSGIAHGSGFDGTSFTAVRQ